ncbi:MAG: FtsX-like permease family protein, partial [Acidimicrobiia bacterium]|nr:FtsX-like permease family protein [Acidimicrobiia bacterium]
DLATAQRLLAQPGQLDAITVAAVDGVDQQQLVERLQTTLEGQGDVEVLTGAEITAEDQNAIRDGLRFFDAFLLAFALVGLVVAGFIVYNTFAILVAQRTRETALLRAIGAGRGQVIGTVVLEAVVVGLLASAAGIVAGVLTAGGLRAMLEALGVDLPADGLVLSSRTIVVSMIAGLGLTAVSAVGPALRASRVAPLAALREISVDRSDRSKLRTIAGVVALVVGAAGVIAGLAQPAPAPAGLGALAIFVGVFVLGPVIAPPVISVLGVPVRALRGTTGSMAVRNALRNPKRTANTATALTVGLALVCAITVLGASLRASIRDTIDGQFTGDFAIESGSFGIGGLSPDLARDIAAVDGVAATSGIRFAVGEINGGADGFSVVDPATAFELFDVGVIAGRGEDLDEHGILVFEDKAADLGVGVGDQVTVHLAGLDPRPLTVVGIYRENSLAGNYAISQSLAAATGHPQFDSSVFVRLDPGATIAEVRPVLAELVAAYPDADLQDRDEYRESQAAQIDQFVNLVYGLLGLAIVIASLGVANTLRLSVLERTRELGLLRAVGMTRAQSRSMVRWEAVLTAVLGAVQGVVIGVFFGWVLIRALRDQGLESFSVPVPSLVVIVAIAAALGVAASIRPARRAARLDVLGAIADH